MSGTTGLWCSSSSSHDRVHVLDPHTATARLLNAWRTDITNGLDALMLAPTREQAAALNAAARNSRLEGTNRCPHHPH